MNILDFFPYYNDIDKNIANNLLHKKEFFDLRYKSKNDNKQLDIDGTLYYKYQVIIHRFLSPYTLYKRILLFWDFGQGKTWGAFAVIDHIIKIKKFKLYDINKIIILVKGPLIKSNWEIELYNKYKDNNFIKNNFSIQSYGNFITKIRKYINSNLSFDKFDKKTWELLNDKYQNTLLVIDEVHNLRIHSTEKKSYFDIHSFIHNITTLKTMLLSGTPMFDDPEEIKAVLNLLNDNDHQIDLNINLSDINNIKKNEQKLLRYMQGNISYLKSSLDNSQLQYQGELRSIFPYEKIIYLEMSDIQKKAYNDLEQLSFEQKQYSFINSDDSTDSNDSNDSNINFDIDIDSINFDIENDIESENDDIKQKNNILIKKLHISNFVFKKDDELVYGNKINLDDLSNIDTLSKLKYYSTKFYHILNEIEQSNDICVYYNKFVERGLNLFAKILDNFGYKKYTDDNKNIKEKKYVHLTKSAKNILKNINEVKNAYGNYVKIYLLSDEASQGISLKHVRKLFKDGAWNDSSSDQIIHRVLRLDSHDYFRSKQESTDIKIFNYASIIDNDHVSADLHKYIISYHKDIAIKYITRLCKISSIDCPLLYEKNKETNPKFNDTKICEYMTCKYECLNTNLKDNNIEYMNYNKYYLDIKEILIVLINIFKIYNSIHINSIFELLNIYKKEQILKVLNYLLTEIITNKNGYLCIINHNNDIYYTTLLSSKTDYNTNVYGSNPIIQNNNIFDRYILSTLFDRLSNKMFDNIKFYLNLLNNKKILTESILKSDNELLKNLLVKTYKEVSINDNIYEHTFDISPKVLIDNKWIDKQLNITFNEELSKKIKYKGIISRDKMKFKILALSEQSSSFKGKDCKSWSVDKLYNLLYIINIQIKDITNNDIKIISKINNDMFDKLISIEPKLKKIIDKNNDKQILFYYNWLMNIHSFNLNKLKYDVNMLCDIIKTYFIKNNLIEYIN